MSSRVALGQLGLRLDHGHLGFCGGQRAGGGRLPLGLVDLGLVAGPRDLGVPFVLGLVAERFLPGLGRGLLRLGLGDLGVPLHGGLVGCGQGGDVARTTVVDGLDLQGVDDQADLLHLRLRLVEHFF